MCAYLSAVSLCLPASASVSSSLIYLFWSRLSKWVVGPERHPGISGGWFSENRDQNATGELEWKPDLATEQPVDRCGQGPPDCVEASSLRLLSEFPLVHEVHSEIPWSGYIQNGGSEECFTHACPLDFWLSCSVPSLGLEAGHLTRPWPRVPPPPQDPTLRGCGVQRKILV